MTRIACRVPIRVEFRGEIDDAVLRELSDALASTIARRIAFADRAIAARQHITQARRTHLAPTVSFVAADRLGDDERARIEAALRNGLARAIGDPSALAHPPARSDFLLAQYRPGGSASGAAANTSDGITIAAGQDRAFWQAIRSEMLVRVINDENVGRRDDAIAILMQGIRRPDAQAVIREGLDVSSFNSGVRLSLLTALERRAATEPIAWDLLLYGVERPHDFTGYGPFERRFFRDDTGLADYLENVLQHGNDEAKQNAARVVRYFLAQQYQTRMASRRGGLDRLRHIAARFGLYARSGLGLAALRDRVDNQCEILLDALDSVRHELVWNPSDDPFQTEDRRTLGDFEATVRTRRSGAGALDAEALDILDVRLARALQMVMLLPERLADIHHSILGIRRILPVGAVSDETTALFNLRHAFVTAFGQVLTSEDALNRFQRAEERFADIRYDVATVKWNRLQIVFNDLRANVDLGTGLHPFGGPIDDPNFYVMRSLLHEYTRTFIDLFTPHGYGTAGFSVTIDSTPESLEQAMQIESDLGIYRLLSAIFLLFSSALRLESDMQPIGSESFRARISERLRASRSELAGFFMRQDYERFSARFQGIQNELTGIRSEIESRARTDANIRTALLIAATLAAGGAGLIVRVALAPALIEASAGAARLAIAVTVTEGTVFTAVQLGGERLAFGHPITPGEAVLAWTKNLASFAAFSVLSRVLTPITRSTTVLGMLARHATNIVFAIDIAAITTVIQTGSFPPDIGRFLLEAVSCYAIMSAFGALGQRSTNELIRTRGQELYERAGELGNRLKSLQRLGLLNEPEFTRIKNEGRELFDSADRLLEFMRGSGMIDADELTAGKEAVDYYRVALNNAHWTGPRTGLRVAALPSPAHIPGLVRVGSTELYRYDPAHPPAELATLAARYAGVSGMTVRWTSGTLIIRDAGNRIRLLIQPGPVPAGLLPAPSPGVPQPRPLTFLEQAAGPLTPAGMQVLNGAIGSINRLAVTELQARGDAGLSALSLLVEHRTSLGSWPIDAVRGLATALELPRGITRATLQRFFLSLPNDRLARLFADYQAVANRPGANFLFDTQFSGQRAFILVGAYREIFARGMDLPTGMTLKAVRGLLRLVNEKGLADGVNELAAVRSVDARLAFLENRDPIVDPGLLPPDPIQAILRRHAQELRPGVNPVDTQQTPQQVVQAIQAYAAAHHARIDTHLPARIESVIVRYRRGMVNLQTGRETDSRTVDGARNELQGLLISLDAGEQVLSFDAPRGAKRGDPFLPRITIGTHAVRGLYTITNAPADIAVQIDLLARTGGGDLRIEETTTGEITLPVPWNALATRSAATLDWNALNDDYPSHRKWHQVMKYVALADFGRAFAQSFGIAPGRVRIVLRASSFSADAIRGLDNLGVIHETL